MAFRSKIAGEWEGLARHGEDVGKGDVRLLDVCICR